MTPNHPHAVKLWLRSRRYQRHAGADHRHGGRFLASAVIALGLALLAEMLSHGAYGH
jgi:hypothetical protein